MAELFSLMPESTSCKAIRVEVSRTRSRSILPAPFQWDPPATGEISRDVRSARLGARRETISRFALEMTQDQDRGSFRAQVDRQLCVVHRLSRCIHREESRPRHLPTFPMRPAKSSALIPSLSAVADGPSAIGESRPWPGQKAQKSITEKAAKRNPTRQNRQHFQGVYFLSQ